MTIEVPNPEALRAGFRHAEEDLSRWDQEEFINYWDGDGEPFDLVEGQEPPCGTTACLAGHILLATGMDWKRISRLDIEREALRVLGFEDPADRPSFSDEVFYQTGDSYGPIGRTRESFDRFKEYVSRMTGVEL